MHSCMVDFGHWSQRPDDQRGVAQFNTEWHSLQLFASKEPVVRVECPFMCQTLIEVRTLDEVSMMPELTSSVLKIRFPT